MPKHIIMKKFLSYLFVVCCISFLFSCQKELSTETDSTLVAQGSLWDTASDCLPSTVHGTFYNGITPGSDTAYVEIQVNVTQTGSYNITSDVQDGIKFLDSGFFSNTGINTVRLKPIGAPIIPVSTIFNISFDTSFCSFTINVQDSTGTGLGGQDSTGTGGNYGTWQFTTDSGQSFQGTFYSASIEKDSLIWGTGNQMLLLQGYTSASTDSAITLILYLPNGVITPGTYSSQSLPPSNASLFAFNFTIVNGGSGDPIYEALPASTTGSNITITIADYNSATHIVTGTFSGTAEDDAYEDATIGIQNGSFTTTVSP